MEPYTFHAGTMAAETVTIGPEDLARPVRYEMTLEGEWAGVTVARTLEERRARIAERRRRPHRETVDLGSRFGRRRYRSVVR